LIHDIINSKAEDKFTSYSIEIDEELHAVILKNKSSGKMGWLKNLFHLNSKQNQNIIWINNPQYRFDLSAIEDYNKIFLMDIPIFISSCNYELAPYFKEKNFELLKFGKEAVLDLSRNHFQKKSLKELIRAGRKNGTVQEFSYSEEHKNKIEEFKKECAHGNEPQLKYFFNDVLLPENRLFVFKNKKEEWQGAITISCLKRGEVRTDLLLRKKIAPKGVMEFLIKFIFDLLKNEGYKKWSLGEVPYVIYGSPVFSKEFLINFTGRRTRFAYDYLGLYNFKNKFDPEWNDIYICSKPKLKLRTLFRISWISNLTKLILEKFLEKFLGLRLEKKN
jgi:lysylphosphatidylglycerol synthetase-like protein (DUF2156 family)